MACHDVEKSQGISMGQTKWLLGAGVDIPSQPGQGRSMGVNRVEQMSKRARGRLVLTTKGARVIVSPKSCFTGSLDSADHLRLSLSQLCAHLSHFHATHQMHSSLCDLGRVFNLP